MDLSPEQTRQMFDRLMSDDYVKALAKDYAAKAAAHFMNELEYQKDILTAKLNSEREEMPFRQQKEKQLQTSTSFSESVDYDKVKRKPIKTELDEEKAMILLEEPSPDGDHMESSGEFSGEEVQAVPVIKVMKINGRNLRRFLRLI